MNKRERGSILPLGIGVIALSLAFSLVTVELIGIQDQTLQAKQLADTFALQVAEDLRKDGIEPIVNLHYNPTITETRLVATHFLQLEPTQVEVVSHDGKTISSTVCLSWKSITGFTLGSLGLLCARSNARAT